MIVAVLVAVAGGVGALLRYLTDRAVQDRVAGSFPWGTATVNVVGSFVLGVVTGLAWHHGLPTRIVAIVGTGLCGGYTTWSTATWEAVRLVEGGQYRHAFGHALGSLSVAVGAAVLGVAAATL